MAHIGKSLGKGDYMGAIITLKISFLSFGVIGIVISLAMMIFRNQIIYTFTSSDDIRLPFNEAIDIVALLVVVMSLNYIQKGAIYGLGG